MKKYVCAAAAAILMIVTVLMPSSALRGRWSGVVWEITDGVLTVSAGDIPDSTASSAAPWMKFADRVTKIVVADGVGVIGARAFEDMDHAVTAELGSVTAIGSMAFSGCSALREIALPDTVESVGDFAFAECGSLKTVSIPASVASIGEGVWEACRSLTRIDCASGRYYSVDGVLMDRGSSMILRYPPAKPDRTYTAPAGVKRVAPGAFRDAAFLESAALPEVRTVGAGAFWGCGALADAGITAAEEIGRAAFWGCTQLEEIGFGAGLSYIGSDAFAECGSLGTADFAGNAPQAGDGIFRGTHSSFTVVIGKVSTGFGDTEWLGYPVIRHGVYGGEIGGIAWSLDSATGVMSVAGSGAIPDFESASDTPWYAYRKLIRSLELDGITRIGDNSFRYTGLRSLELPAGVMQIGAWAFSGCVYLKDAVILGKANVGECAFFGNTDLAEAELRQAAAIGKQAFSGCEALEFVFTGKTAPSLGEYAFDGTPAAVLYPVGGIGYDAGLWREVYSEAYLAGDANGDGRCNISDVSLLLKYVAMWDVQVKRVSADTNADGKLNLTDASNMLKHIAGWDIVIGYKFTE